jgi:Ca2+-binding RTX toxin-like protein
MTTFSLDGIPVIQFDVARRNYFFGNSGNSTATGGANVGLGTWALHSLQAGGANVGIGDFALAALTNTFGNIAIGNQALMRAVTPTDVTAIGDQAGAFMTTGVGATLVGKFAFQNVLQAYGNTGVGDSTGRFTIDGQLNTAIGYRSFEGNLHGHYNVAVGAGSMLVRDAGSGNTAIGYNALGGASTVLGENNTALGFEAGLDIEGSGNIVIGVHAGSNQLQNSAVENSIAIGNNTFTTTSNQIVLGNSDSQSFVVAGISYTADQLIALLGIAEQSGAAPNQNVTPFTDALRGDDNANILDGAAGADLLYGRGGDDTYAVDNSGDRPFENLNEGTDAVEVATGVNYTLANSTEIEVLRAGTPSSTTVMNLTGNEFANTVIGNAGRNRLDGGEGADTLQGLAGDDTYVVDSIGDVVVEIAAGGSDTVLVSTEITYSLSATAMVEFLATESYLGALNINLTANDFNNTLTGNAGNNILTGLGGDDQFDGDGGNDTFLGGNGNDWFYAGTGIDIFDGGSGNDALYYFLSQGGGITINLATGLGSGGEAEGDSYANIERAYGTNSNDMLIGGQADEYLGGFGGADTINGGNGNDTLDGGTAADILDGGDGIDTAYYLRSTVGVNVNLQTGINTGGEAQGDQLSNVENITGSNSSDHLTGSSGNNVLNGLGGNDTIRGGQGNDTILGGTGTDTAVYAGVLADYDFTFNAATQTYAVYGADGSIDQVKDIELFQFDDQSVAAADLPLASSPPQRTASVTADSVSMPEGNTGTTAYTFTVSLDAAVFGPQTIDWSATGTGTNPADAADFSSPLSGTLNFAAGEVSKTITLLVSGDTTAEFNEAFDVTLTSPSSGITLGTSTATGTITNDDLNLVLGTSGNDALLNGTAANDEIRGLDGNDRLDGLDGLDTLIGGAGADTFAFTTLATPDNIEMINDFNPVEDGFELGAGSFTGLVAGALSLAEFVLGTSANDADDRIIYDAASGALSFDSDGTGAAAAQQFATVQPNLTITHDDFMIA